MPEASFQTNTPLAGSPQGVSISAMRIESDRVVLLVGSGIPVGEIDSRSIVFG